MHSQQNSEGPAARVDPREWDLTNVWLTRTQKREPWELPPTHPRQGQAADTAPRRPRREQHAAPQCYVQVMV